MKRTRADRRRAWSPSLRDPAFRRLALCLGASQFAAVALQTLWVATWLRDVAGYAPAEVARGAARGQRVDDRRATWCSAAPPTSCTGAAAARCRCWSAAWRLRRSASLLRDWRNAKACCSGACSSPAGRRWCSPIRSCRAAIRRRWRGAPTPRSTYSASSACSAASGASAWCSIFGRRPTHGYAAEGYAWALGMAWAVQLAGLAWLWSGRALLAPRPATVA